jgi:uncharacterized small protein (DUF1192 family)
MNDSIHLWRRDEKPSHPRIALIQGAIERVHAEPSAQLQLKVKSNSLDGLVDSVVD